MSEVRFDISVSLDGYVAGHGDDVDALHDWLLGLRDWREPHGLEGGDTGPDNDVMGAAFEGVGAHVVSRRMYDLTGGWGTEPPFGKPTVVVTHRVREPDVRGATTFEFVEGVEQAIGRARELAGDLDVSVGGGASVAQQAIAAGLVDVMQLHLVPVLLGGGVRLFEELGTPPPKLEAEEVVAASSAVTHLRYRFSPS